METCCLGYKVSKTNMYSKTKTRNTTTNTNSTHAELHSYTSNCFQMKTEMQETNFIKQKQILTNFMQFIELFHFVFGFSFSIRNA